MAITIDSGSRKNIRRLQSVLQAMGEDVGGIDGIAGDRTEAALQSAADKLGI